ncbi:MAG: hypothetical protein GC204_09335 [Chloroflexi bacterium]|nr:hypothetical protein [Chloroflexota bacterium]
MNSHKTCNPIASVYPAPPTIPGDITPADQAIYVPAITKGYAQDVWTWSNAGSPRALPTGVSAADLDFLNPANKLFRISHALTSAGLALKQKRDCIITRRSKTDTVIIADSGGFQVASNRLKVRNDQDRELILRWQEQFDIAITLDVPTGPLTNPTKAASYAYASFNDCLSATVQHLDYYEKHRKADIIWLNVLQGNNPQQCDIWYNTVRQRFHGQGWAFAGPLRNNFYELLRRILIMCRHGELQEKKWIHILGTSELDTAVLLTALQRAINRHINPNIRISYDTSSPFRNLAWNNAFTIPTFDAKGMTMPTRDAPDGLGFVGSRISWPWPSPLGDRMLLGDFCVPKTLRSKRYRDTQSNHLLAHHNLAALCWGIALANRVFDAETIDHNHTIAYSVGLAAEAIERVIEKQSLTVLYNNKSLFSQLRHGTYDYDSEEERDFPDVP